MQDAYNQPAKKYADIVLQNNGAIDDPLFAVESELLTVCPKVLLQPDRMPKYWSISAICPRLQFKT